GAAERSGNVADTVAPVQHQHGSQSAGIIFIVCFMDGFLHQASFVTGNWCYDRHCSVRLVICFDLAIDQIAQSGLSSLKVIYYSAQLFSVVICYLYAVFQSQLFCFSSERASKITLNCKHGAVFSIISQGYRY
ncbi:hypothetical protein CBL21_10600, partial [Shigella flexneri]